VCVSAAIGAMHFSIYRGPATLLRYLEMEKGDLICSIKINVFWPSFF